MNVINQMINELELSYPNMDFKKTRDYIEKTSSEEVLKNTLDVLQKYTLKLNNIQSEQKIKSKEYLFLNEIKLFNETLDFNSFKDENKNTKKTLCKYLHSILISSLVTKVSPEELEKMFKKEKDDLNLNSLMGNKELVKIAEDITNDLKNENVDPMSLMSSLLSGKSNKNIDKIVNKIQSKIETGELNKDELEKQAQLLMNNDLFKSFLQK